MNHILESGQHPLSLISDILEARQVLRQLKRMRMKIQPITDIDYREIRTTNERDEAL